MSVESLPHLNATLNGLATILLLVGYVLIRQQRERAHRAVMLACFGVSVAFFCSYLIYHAQVGSRHFSDTAPSAVRVFYFTVLITHVILAALVPFLAVATIYLGLTNRRSAHRKLARWTFPIWLYVSLTGVVVYLMMYQGQRLGVY